MAVASAVVADARPLRRDLLCASLDAGGVATAARCASGSELLAVCTAEAPDVALCAEDLPGIDDVMDRVLRTGTRLLMVGDAIDVDRLSSLLLRGAAGYLPLDESPIDAVQEAVRSVARGQAMLHPLVARAILHQWREIRNEGTDSVELTKRELEVLHAMGEGLAAKAVARRLGVALKTVEHHKGRIYAKLGARNHAHAIARAAALGLLTTSEGDQADEGTGSRRSSA